MEKIVIPVCEGCEKPIREPHQGIIVVGSIHHAALDEDGDVSKTELVGGWHEDETDSEMSPATTAWCRACFDKAVWGVGVDPYDLASDAELDRKDQEWVKQPAEPQEDPQAS